MTCNPKYILVGGYVYRDDGDRHFVSPHRLLALYQLDPRECRMAYDSGALMGMKQSEFIVLGPRADGDYIEHRLKKEEEWEKSRSSVGS
jgi:hypothetical protein